MPTNILRDNPGFSFTGVVKATGDLVRKGKLVGVVHKETPTTGDTGWAQRGVVANVPKDSSTFSQGDICYFDVGNGNRVTSNSNSGANPTAGLVTQVANSLTGEATVEVFVFASA